MFNIQINKIWLVTMTWEVVKKPKKNLMYETVSNI